jgi:U3 small nucleolar RNA-associated protein 25
MIFIILLFKTINFSAEIKYRQKRQEVESSESDDNDEVETNDFQELLSTLRSSKKQKNEAESSESSDESEEEDQADERSENSEPEVDSVNEDGSSDQEDEADDDYSDLEMSETEEKSEDKTADKTVNMKFLDDSLENDLVRDDSSDSDEEFNSDEENEDQSSKKSQHQHMNPFSNHFKHDMSQKLFEAVSSAPPKTEISKLHWPILQNIIVDIPKTSSEPSAKKRQTLLGDEEVFTNEGQPPKICNPLQLTKEISLKQQIVQNIPNANQENLDNDSKILTPLQTELISIASNYQDLYYPHRTHANGEEIRLTYCMHALDHILKTRQKVLHHNSKISKLKASKKSVIVPDEFRDQGFVRPRVLIVLPFRDSAYRVVNMLINLLNPSEKASIVNYSRFVDEFTGDTLYFPKKNPKPDDYEQTFSGNTEDTFRIGLSLTKKSMKLYSPFYSSDILIASPLGLRLIIGAPGEKDREFDFLASVEMLILDQMELFLAQNWDHLLYLFDHLHLQPQSRQNTDFSRVRSWCLNGWSKFYRQTLLFSSYDLPEFRSLLNNRCRNYAGKVRTANNVVNGSIRHVVMEVPQVFHRIEVKTLESSFDTRFEYFTNTILPQFKSATMAHSMIYIPSYFDYVRIRNYFKKEEINFTQICEYTKDNKISRARTLFYHGGAHFLLYSERAHFFRRIRVKGIRHIIMYQPPLWNNFYPEMVNLMQEANQNPRDDVVKNSMSVTVLYTKYDILQLSAIVGHENVAKMLASKKQTHMFKNNE